MNIWESTKNKNNQSKIGDIIIPIIQFKKEKKELKITFIED